MKRITKKENYSIKLTFDQINTLWIILNEVQKTIDTGEVEEDGVVYANYENYMLPLDSCQVKDLAAIIKKID